MKNLLLTGSLVLLTGIAATANTGVVNDNPGIHIFHKESKGPRKEARELRKEKKDYSIPYYQTDQQFMRDFPDATNVVWDTKDLDKATFILNGKTMRAYYDLDNELIGTVTDASYSDLPASATKFIEKHYGEYTPEQVLYFDDNQFNDTDMTLYGSPFDDEDNYFVEMHGANKTIILQVNMRGDVNFFKDITHSNVKY